MDFLCKLYLVYWLSMRSESERVGKKFDLEIKDKRKKTILSTGQKEKKKKTGGETSQSYRHIRWQGENVCGRKQVQRMHKPFF